MIIITCLFPSDLFAEYDDDLVENTDVTIKDKDKDDAQYAASVSSESKMLNYVAPSIDAPALQDQIVLLKGPDKGREGVVLWISKGRRLRV